MEIVQGEQADIRSALARNSFKKMLGTKLSFINIAWIMCLAKMTPMNIRCNIASLFSQMVVSLRDNITVTSGKQNSNVFIVEAVGFFSFFFFPGNDSYKWNGQQAFLIFLFLSKTADRKHTPVVLVIMKISKLLVLSTVFRKWESGWQLQFNFIMNLVRIVFP